MKIEKIQISKLKNHSKNPKLHIDDKIAESIKEFGYVEPIIIDENNVILAGHGRLKALKKLGNIECEVIRKTGLTEKQKEKYLLLSNQLTIAGGWDLNLLKDFDTNLLIDIGFDKINFDIKENRIELKHIFQIVIPCENEKEQEKIYNQLKDKYKCQILTL